MRSIRSTGSASEPLAARTQEKIKTSSPRSGADASLPAGTVWSGWFSMGAPVAGATEPSQPSRHARHDASTDSANEAARLSAVQVAAAGRSIAARVIASRPDSRRTTPPAPNRPTTLQPPAGRTRIVPCTSGSTRRSARASDQSSHHARHDGSRRCTSASRCAAEYRSNGEAADGRTQALALIAPHREELLDHLVGRGDDLRRSLVAPLHDDQVENSLDRSTLESSMKPARTAPKPLCWASPNRRPPRPASSNWLSPACSTASGDS